MARKAYPDRLKRLSYVSTQSQEDAKEMGLISSDDDSEDAAPRKKVRKELSVWELKKESEHFEAGEDHIYTKGKDLQQESSLTKRRCDDRLTRPYVTRSNSVPSRGTESLYERKRKDRPYSPVTVRKQKCYSKNAVLARLNREKKKQYISSLETSNEHLQQRNNEITQKVTEQEKVIASLQYEVKYLKSLLANSKEISQILRNLKDATGLPISSSLLVSNEDKMVSDNDGTDLHSNPGTPVCNKMFRPMVKRVTTGSNFPIMQDDVYLGYIDSKLKEDVYENERHEETDLSLSTESDLSLESAILNNSDLDLDYGLSIFDCPVDTNELENNNKQEDIFKFEGDCDINEFESDVGVCLHVNKRKISVEFCPECNSRAQMQ